MRPYPLPELREPTLRATYRGYYAKEHGRLCCVFFGAWMGTSWDSADDAQKKLGPPEPGDQVLGFIDVGTHEVWS